MFGSQQLKAATSFHQAYSHLHNSINRLSKGIYSVNTLPQIAALYSAEVKLRDQSATTISNIDFPAAERSDVKALLVADAAVEDAESTIAGDETQLTPRCSNLTSELRIGPANSLMRH
jgi:hypothetical protein